MNRWVMLVAAVLLLVNSAQAYDPQSDGLGVAEAATFSGGTFTGPMQMCFSRAMVGMDSVINSRLGVPPEHVLALAARLPQTAGIKESTDESFAGQRFDEPMLTMMLAAYLWQGSPHSYAIKVFYECAAEPPVMAGRSDFLP